MVLLDKETKTITIEEQFWYDPDNPNQIDIIDLFEHLVEILGNKVMMATENEMHLYDGWDLEEEALDHIYGGSIKTDDKIYSYFCGIGTLSRGNVMYHSRSGWKPVALRENSEYLFERLVEGRFVTFAVFENGIILESYTSKLVHGTIYVPMNVP